MRNIDQALMVAAIDSKVVTSQEAAKQLHSLMRSSDPEERQKGYDALNAKLEDLGNAVHFGSVSDESMKYVPRQTKSFDSIYDPSSTRAYTFDLLSTLLNLDAKWMQFYQMVPAYGAAEVDTMTITNLVEHKEYLQGARIEMGPLAGLSDTVLREKRYGGGSTFLERWVTTNGMMTINSILTRHQVAELKLKASVAYTALADTSGVGVEAFATSIVHTINEGVNTLSEALLALQYEITDESQFLLLSNSGNKEAINAAFRTIQGENGTNPLLEYNVTPVYTRNSNVARDLGLGGANRAMLILPGVVNIWADFQTAKVGQETSSGTDSLNLFYQYYFNQQVTSAQKRVITLA